MYNSISNARLIADLVDHSDLTPDDEAVLLLTLTDDVYGTHRMETELPDDRTLISLTLDRDDDGCQHVAIIAVYYEDRLESLQYLVDATLHQVYLFER
jgi:hypothetical protein